MTRSPSVFRPLSPPRNLKDELVARLTEEITNGKLKPSDRLPTEQEMIATFGVSRTVVREAISALRAEGLVETRQGAGAFVASDMRLRPFRIDPHGLQTVQGVLDVMELRMGIEIEAAGLAAERRRDKDIETIRRILDTFGESVERGEEAVEADFDFHRAVAKATRNTFFLSFLDFLGWHIIPRRSIHLESQDEATHRAYLRKVLAEHHSILRTISEGDAQAARRAMRRHLVRGRDRYVAFARGARR